MARALSCIFFCLILVYCSVIATNQGLASLYAYPGLSTLTLWREGKRQPQVHEWMTVRRSLERALSHDAYNPDLLQALGAAYDAEVAYFPPAAAVAARNRNSARQYYLEALAARPVWPHDWIALALVKYRQNAIDDEFYRALYQAVALGPWEPGVQFVVADIGMHHWNRFDAGMHELVMGVIHDALEYNAGDMIRLARRYDMVDVVCAADFSNESAGQFCRQYQQR